MSVKYLVETVKQPNKICCWAAAFLMLKRYARRRSGLLYMGSAVDGPLERMIGISSTKASRTGAAPISWKDVGPWCSALGFHWEYIEKEPWALERALSLRGPLVHIANLPGTGWQHALVLTGLYTHPVDVYRVMFNDPDGGKRREMSFLDFSQSYPPLFDRPTSQCIIYALPLYRRAGR